MDVGVAQQREISFATFSNSIVQTSTGNITYELKGHQMLLGSGRSDRM